MGSCQPQVLVFVVVRRAQLLRCAAHCLTAHANTLQLGLGGWTSYAALPLCSLDCLCKPHTSNTSPRRHAAASASFGPLTTYSEECWAAAGGADGEESTALLSARAGEHCSMAGRPAHRLYSYCWKLGSSFACCWSACQSVGSVACQLQGLWRWRSRGMRARRCGCSGRRRALTLLRRGRQQPGSRTCLRCWTGAAAPSCRRRIPPPESRRPLAATLADASLDVLVYVLGTNWVAGISGISVRSLRLPLQVLNAQASGARGVIVANDEAGGLLVEMGGDGSGREPAIPALGISADTGAALRCVSHLFSVQWFQSFIGCGALPLV
jgi:PA domain